MVRLLFFERAAELKLSVDVGRCRSQRSSISSGSTDTLYLLSSAGSLCLMLTGLMCQHLYHLFKGSKNIFSQSGSHHE